VEGAIAACEHVAVDMARFPAADLPPAELCAERVRECDVYVGVLGTRYGSPVTDQPEVSYTELEFVTATEAGLERLVFLLSTEAEDVGIPLSGLIDHEHGARQEAFRRRVREDSGLVVQTFTDPGTLGQLVERSLRELAGRRRGSGSGGRGPAVVVTGEIPQEPLGFQPRAGLLAALDAPGPGTRVVHALTGMRGVGKTHLAAAYARAKVVEGWRLVAWINAEEQGGLLAGLAEVATGLGLDVSDAQAAGRAVRHRLEVDGDRCLLVFDNAVDVQLLRPFVPAVGAARVIVTSNQQAMAFLGTGVPVDVFSAAEALTFLAARTGRADVAGAEAVAAELGLLPLALAQAAAVIAGQHLSYGTYLDRLRRLRIEDLLVTDLDRRLMRLRRRAMWFLNSLGDSAALAIVIGERLLADHARSVGPDHPDTLTSHSHLAAAYLAAGRIDEAITSHQEILADRERTLGPDHPSTLTSHNNLAAVYRAADRTDEADGLER
jgi:hypothetical protein